MKKLKIFVILLFPAVLITGLVFLLKSLKIKEISCRSQFGECSSFINEKLYDITECSFLECKKNIDTVLSDVWIVDKYSYQLKLPFRIETNVIERKPKYSLKTSSNNFVDLVDSSGLVINVKESTSLPGLIINNNLPNLGEKVSDEVLFALQIVYGVSKIQSIEAAKLENNYLSVDMMGGRQVILPLTGDRDFLLGSLTLILSELKKDELNSKIVGVDGIETIDLRYKNPILK